LQLNKKVKMSELDLKVVELAEELLAEGQLPTEVVISERLGLSRDEAGAALSQWARSLSYARLPEVHASAKLHNSVPESLSKGIEQIWDLALQEAMAELRVELQSERAGDEEDRKATRDMVRDAESLYRDLEVKYRTQSQQMDKSEQALRAIEAEMGVLKANIASEINQRKKAEQVRTNLETELSQLRKMHEDAKKTFDARIKAEQQQALENVTRAEVEARHYRNALEKLRDEGTRTESELTRSVHENQAQIAKKDARLEMQEKTISDLERDLNELKENMTSASRDISNINSKLLRETNANRRLEAQIKERDDQVRVLNQKLTVSATEAAKRESVLRQQLKEKDESLTRSTARVNSLEKRITQQEDQIRRLNARL
jgi:chromosome segregation ATPase